MGDGKGYKILHNGVPRTFRDRKEIAYEAARFLKVKAKGEIIEIVDQSTGAKTIVLADGRLG
jgi:hypothetical protein